jgi:hypothetical protein
MGQNARQIASSKWKIKKCLLGKLFEKAWVNYWNWEYVGIGMGPIAC